MAWTYFASAQVVGDVDPEVPLPALRSPSCTLNARCWSFISAIRFGTPVRACTSLYGRSPQRPIAYFACEFLSPSFSLCVVDFPCQSAPSAPSAHASMIPAMPAGRINNAHIRISAHTFVESAADRDSIDTLLLENLTENGQRHRLTADCYRTVKGSLKFRGRKPTCEAFGRASSSAFKLPGSTKMVRGRVRSSLQALPQLTISRLPPSDFRAQMERSPH